MLEYVCNEKTGSREGWTGRLSDSQKSQVNIGPEILQRYTGTYVEQKPFWAGDVPRVFEVTFTEGALFLEQNVLGSTLPTRLNAQSETIFTYGGQAIEFVTDSRGEATHLLDTHVSGDYGFERKK